MIFVVKRSAPSSERHKIAFAKGGYDRAMRTQLETGVLDCCGVGHSDSDFARMGLAALPSFHRNTVQMPGFSEA